MKINVPEHILSIAPYTPGKPIEELEREYGIQNSVKLASNENPLGPSPMAVAAAVKALNNLHRYPDGAAHDLSAKLAGRLGVNPENIVLGNGSDEVIALLAQALLRPGDEVVIPRPSFLMYDITVRSVGATPVYVPLTELHIDLDAVKESITAATRMIFICSPNNPTGTVVCKSDMERFLADLPENIVVVLDEAYLEFVRDPDAAKGNDYIDESRPLVSLRTFSKAYGLAGMRVGYGIMPSVLSNLLHRIRLPFNVSLPAQAAAGAALDDDGFLEKSVCLVHEGLEFLYHALDEMGLGYFPTQTNFFLVDVARDAHDVFEKLLGHGIIVRSMRSYGYNEYLRVNVGLPEENRRFVTALAEVLDRAR
ncbi:MAG: histidinol-phosphate transaminase [Deltaproteobacteria bacterium]|nr:MAG: histidinol-phosphate transaminase [Deltaproteobacteria bacterium]